jgi:multiple antibiotic resistance protein
MLWVCRCLSSWMLLPRFADKLERLFGPLGSSIVIRLSAFILVCIGIQIMFNGMKDFYDMLHAVAQ